MSEIKKIWKEFHAGQKKFGEDISRIINFILLTIVYFFGVGISWIITRFRKEDMLEIKIDKKAKTYWNDLKIGNKPIKEHYRQF